MTTGAVWLPFSQIACDQRLEIVFYRSADLEIVGLILGIGRDGTGFVRPVEQLQAEIHLGQYAELAETRDANLGALDRLLCLLGCQLHFGRLRTGAGLRRGSRRRRLRLRRATYGLFLKGQGRKCCAQQHDRQAAYVS